MFSTNNISYILLFLLLTTIVNTIIDHKIDFYKLLRGIIIVVAIFKIHQYYHNTNQLKKMPIHNSDFEYLFLKLKGKSVDKNKKIFKSLIKQLNKYNHWYKLSLGSRNKSPTEINQYYENTLFYYNETMNNAHSLTVSNNDGAVENNKLDNTSIIKLIKNLKSKMSSDLVKLKRLIVNNGITPNINKPANIGLVEPDDTGSCVYRDNYSIF